MLVECKHDYLLWKCTCYWHITYRIVIYRTLDCYMHLDCHIVNIKLIRVIGLSHVEPWIELLNIELVCVLDLVYVNLLDWYMLDWIWYMCTWTWYVMVYVNLTWHMIHVWIVLDCFVFFRYLTKYLMYLPPLPSLFPDISGRLIISSVPNFRHSDQQQHKQCMFFFEIS